MSMSEISPHWLGADRIRLRVVALVTVLTALIFLLGVSSAFASRSLDPYGYCYLHSYVPNTSGSQYQPQGQITCQSYPSSSVYLQVCGDVYNANGNWYQTSGCFPNDSGPYFFSNTTNTNYQGYYLNGVCGHTYRTLSHGSDNSTGYITYDYASSGENQCG